MVKKLEELIKYQGQLPDKLKVQITKSDDWGYAVKILNLHGCFTQVEDAGELFVMVNDAVYAYFNIPDGVIPSMPRYFPIERIRKELQKWEKSIPANFLERPIVFTQSGVGANL
ncbi:MAG: hypothetical protein ACKKMW_01180 [Candidatus Nealsonbacteria bacterium]